jgi:hypothetical protein
MGAKSAKVGCDSRNEQIFRFVHSWCLHLAKAPSVKVARSH